ncbi:hypothetical protein GCG54_00007676 [Colletotrichum gloeosporioides]|uniref:Uncharacterized protein n=1 Tax=Colletotrichum gloeosporioides TaxID=474922 RepID=A0A8H4CPV8_COLGL|nr:uncharacterized protein GCG54_00007676 [Colletotrichum gloeosporioides]KAF3807940.1 hypothetical protein GCG54_00007676 [Colletotrichum gloeosporioides]
MTAVYLCNVGRSPREMPRWRGFAAGLDDNAFHAPGLIPRRQHRRGEGLNSGKFLLSELRIAPGKPFYAAIDPRNISFGTLSITADMMSLHLRPDYSKTTLHGLEYCTFPKNKLDPPSWVLEWRKVVLNGVEINPMSHRDLFRSSGNRSQPEKSGVCDLSDRVLRRRGCLVDTVTSVFQIGVFEGRKQTLSDAFISEKFRSWALKSIMDFSTPFLKPPAAEIRLWRTMVSD